MIDHQSAILFAFCCTFECMLCYSF